MAEREAAPATLATGGLAAREAQLLARHHELNVKHDEVLKSVGATLQEQRARVEAIDAPTAAGDADARPALGRGVDGHTGGADAPIPVVHAPVGEAGAQGPGRGTRRSSAQGEAARGADPSGPPFSRLARPRVDGGGRRRASRAPAPASPDHNDPASDVVDASLPSPRGLSAEAQARFYKARLAALEKEVEVARETLAKEVRAGCPRRAGWRLRATA